MSNAGERTFAETLNTWVQIIAIVVAAAWGGYTFFYKEIMVPKSAPINITMNLQLKKVGKGNVKNQLVPIEMHISATNPSSRKVYLLPSIWFVYAQKVGPSGEIPDFNQRAAALMSAQQGQSMTRYAQLSPPTIVAAGSLFPDESLNPGETLTATTIFYVPREKYDLLEAQTVMPSAQVESGVELEWTFDEKGQALSTMFLVGPGGERKPMTKEKGSYSDHRLGLQSATSVSALSLQD